MTSLGIKYNCHSVNTKITTRVDAVSVVDQQNVKWSVQNQVSWTASTCVQALFTVQL